MEKIKLFLVSEKGKDLIIVLIVILVGLSSFGLGRLSKGQNSPGIKILPAPAGEYQNSNALSTVATPQSFFASNRGKKYYPVGCEAGKNIKQENRVYFASESLAQKAGYARSSSCN